VDSRVRVRFAPRGRNPEPAAWRLRAPDAWLWPEGSGRARVDTKILGFDGEIKPIDVLAKSHITVCCGPPSGQLRVVVNAGAWLDAGLTQGQVS